MYDADCLEKIGANVKFLRTMRKAAPAGCSANAGHQSDPSEQYGMRPRQVQPETAAAPGQPFDCQLECFLTPAGGQRSSRRDRTG